ncbi:hypothetical protein MBLNU230_g3818t1 [Neophaeotheca triangularis]
MFRLSTILITLQPSLLTSTLQTPYSNNTINLNHRAFSAYQNLKCHLTNHLCPQDLATLQHTNATSTEAIENPPNALDGLWQRLENNILRATVWERLAQALGDPDGELGLPEVACRFVGVLEPLGVYWWDLELYDRFAEAVGGRERLLGWREGVLGESLGYDGVVDGRTEGVGSVGCVVSNPTRLPGFNGFSEGLFPGGLVGDEDSIAAMQLKKFEQPPRGLKGETSTVPRNSSSSEDCRTASSSSLSSIDLTRLPEEQTHFLPLSNFRNWDNETQTTSSEILHQQLTPANRNKPNATSDRHCPCPHCNQPPAPKPDPFPTTRPSPPGDQPTHPALLDATLTHPVWGLPYTEQQMQHLKASSDLQA